MSKLREMGNQAQAGLAGAAAYRLRRHFAVVRTGRSGKRPRQLRPHSALSKASTPWANGSARTAWNGLNQLLWTQESDADNGIYRCINRYADSIPASLTESFALSQEQ
jgi:hypothetical protein